MPLWIVEIWGIANAAWPSNLLIKGAWPKFIYEGSPENTLESSLIEANFRYQHLPKVIRTFQAVEHKNFREGVASFFIGMVFLAFLQT